MPHVYASKAGCWVPALRQAPQAVKKSENGNELRHARPIHFGQREAEDRELGEEIARRERARRHASSAGPQRTSARLRTATVPSPPFTNASLF